MAAELSIEKVLKSMGIEDYDPLVVQALHEYSRRLASELLCDARDYSLHCYKSEIDIRDAKLAISLHDTRVIGMDPRVKLTDVCEQLNSIALPAIPQSIRHRLCKLSRVRERTYTYVPGSEAYPEPESGLTRTHSSSTATPRSSNNKKQKTMKIPIKMLPPQSNEQASVTASDLNATSSI